MGDVSQIHCRIANHLDRQVVQLVHFGGAGVHIDVVFELVDFNGSGRQYQILQRQGVRHVGGRQPFGLQERGVEIDHDLALLAAIRVGNGCPGHGDELSSQEVETDIVEILLSQAGKRQLQDGN